MSQEVKPSPNEPQTGPLFEYHFDAYTRIYEKEDGIFLFLAGPKTMALISLIRPGCPITNSAVNEWLQWLKREAKRQEG